MTKDILTLIFWVAVIIFAPLATIWSLNTLFALGIAISIKSWFAMIWIQMATFGSVTAAINNKKITKL